MSKIGTAILEIRTDTGQMSAGLSSALKDARTFGDQIGAIAQSAGKALAAAFVVTEVVALGKQFLDFAGNVSDLSARLNISTDTVQEWQATFGKASIPVESVAKSSEILSEKLNGGDKSAVAALKAMGFSVAELQAMRPEDRFIKVADAVGQLQNQDDKIAASKGLFGKGGPELLAALDGHLEETIGGMREMGLVIDEETIAAADDFGDQLGLMGQQLLGIVATVVGPLLPALSALGNILSWLGRNVVGPVLGGAIKVAMTLLAGFVETVTGLLSKLAALGAHLPGVGDKFAAMGHALDDVSKKTGAYMVDLWKTKDATTGAGDAAPVAARKIAGLGDAHDDAGKKAKKQADELDRLREKIAGIDAAIGTGLFAKTSDFGAAGVEADIARAKATVESMQAALGIERGAGGHVWDIGVQLDLADARNVLGALEEETATSFGGALQSAIGTLPALLTQAFTGGGGFAGALKAFTSQIGGSLGRGLFEAGGLLNGVGNKLAGIFGSSLGLALPGIGQVIGSLLGAALPKVWNGIKKLFGGPSQAEQDGRALSKQFEDSFGGFNQMMDALGNDAETLGKPRAEIERLVKAMLDAQKRGPEAVRPWLEQLQRIRDEAAAAREATTQATEDAARQADELSKARMSKAEQELTDLIDKRKALAAGLAQEADEETKGVIQLQQEAELENLDAQIADKGDQYAELAKETGQAMADAIVEALKDLQVPPVGIPTFFTGAGAGAGALVPPVVPMADGGFGRVTGPTLFYSAGQEDFAFSGEGRRFGGRGGGGDVVIHLDGREIARGTLPHFADAARAFGVTG